MEMYTIEILLTVLKIIFENGEIKIGAVEQYIENQGKILKLYLVTPEGLKKILEVFYHELQNKIFRITNFVDLKYEEIMVILKNIGRMRKEFYTLVEQKYLGFVSDEYNNVIAYIGSRAIDIKGNYIPIDVTQNLQLYRQKGDLLEQINKYKEFVKSSILRQIIMLEIFSSVLCGIVGKNIVCTVCGESSTGKTTIIKFFTAAFASIECRSINKNFNTTDNALIEMLNWIMGVPQYFDDFTANDKTSSGKKRNITSLLYALQDGEIKNRCNRNCKGKFATTIIMTAEESILDTCDIEKKGILPRVIELEVRNNDLFKNSTECWETKKWSKENYGLVGIEYVSQLLKSHTIEQMQNDYYTEVDRLKEIQTESHGMLSRMQETIAMITLTARYIEEIFDIRFNVEEIHRYLLNITKEKLEENIEMAPEKRLVEQYYMKLINFVKENHPEDVEETGVAIRNSDYNELTSKAGQSYNLSVKKALKKYGLLKVDTGRTYDKNLGKGRGKGIYLLFNPEFMEGDYE